MKLNEIKDNPGARQARKRVGRGPGSGTGTTAGRGYKGQKSRSGVALKGKGFEGGQMPLQRRLPKRGFNNIFAKRFNEVNIGRIQQAVDAKKLDAKKPVTVDALVEAGVVRRALDGVRLLGMGELSAKLEFEVAGVSKSAQAAVEKAGGSVKIAEYKQPSTKPAKKPADKPQAKDGADTAKPAAKKDADKKPAAKKPASKQADTKKTDTKKTTAKQKDAGKKDAEKKDAKKD